MQGFSHEVLALVFVLIFAVAGVAYVVSGHAQTPVAKAASCRTVAGTRNSNGTAFYVEITECPHTQMHGVTALGVGGGNAQQVKACVQVEDSHHHWHTKPETCRTANGDNTNTTYFNCYKGHWYHTWAWGYINWGNVTTTQTITSKPLYCL